MTMWGKFVRKSRLEALEMRRIPVPDGDELSLAVATTPRSGPVLLILHGLEGGVHSHYIGGLWAAARRNGWQPHLLLFRTCDGRMNRARRTYHSGETADLDRVVQSLIGSRPGRPIGLAGVSLGANVLLKWMGEQGDGLAGEVRAAVAVSAPFDLARASKAIGSGFSRLYEWNFLRSLKRKARQKLVQYPEVCSLRQLDAVSSLWCFDNHFTAPLHGFADAADYYARSSSIGYLARIRRPTLLLSAYDDPFHTRGVLTDVVAVASGNPQIEHEFHDRGGHVGFVGSVPWKPTYYVDSRVDSFLAGYLPPDRSRAAGVVSG
jgi:predicted alpha/beta-fold hydrolase